MSRSRAPFPPFLPLFSASGSDSKMSDVDGQPYTTLLYSNGPGYTHPRNILREAGKDSIQVKKEKKKKKKRDKPHILAYSKIYAAMFIGSENDRGEISGARLKIHHALSRGSFAKYSMELFPTSYIPSSFVYSILSNLPLSFAPSLLTRVSVSRSSLALPT